MNGFCMSSLLPSILCNRNAAVISFLVFVALTVLFLVTSKYWIGEYDEGLILTGAFRILNGEIPSRDFYVIYGPGQFYILAGLFKIFGVNLLTARIYDSAVNSCIVIISFLLLKRNYPRWYSLCGSICVVAVLVRYQLDLYPINPVLMITLATAVSLISLLSKGSSALSYISVSIGIALILLFRYDVSIMVFAAIGVPIILVKIINFHVFKEHPLEQVWQTILIFIVLTIMPAISVILLTKAGIFMPALQDLLTYNSKNYVEMRSLPFPGVETLKNSPIEFIFIYFPVFVSIFPILIIVFSSISSNKLRTEKRTQQLIQIIVFSSLTYFLFVKGWVRTSGSHMMLSNINAMLLLFMCAYEIGYFLTFDKPTVKPVVKSGSGIHVGVWWLSLTLFICMLKLDYESNPIYRHYNELEFHKDFPSLSFFMASPNQLKTALYITNNTEINERIYSATGRHDKIFVNDASIYFITKRMPASRWHHYDPGVQNSEKVQREIINDLEKNGVSLILKDMTWDNMKEPNKSAESSNVFTLDQYFEKYFHEVISYGPQHIFHLNSNSTLGIKKANISS